MTLGELDQAFGKKITNVIEPFPLLQFIHTKQYTASFSEEQLTLSRRFTLSRQPIVTKVWHKEVPSLLTKCKQ